MTATIEDVTAAAEAYAASAADLATAPLQATIDQQTAALVDLYAQLSSAQVALATATADDATDESKIAALSAQLLALQAQLAAAQASVSSSYVQPTTGLTMPTAVGSSSPSIKTPVGSLVLLPAGDLSGYWKDYAEANGFAGMFWQAAKIFGAGIDKTILGVTENTLAAAKIATIKALKKGQTNQYYVARVGGGTELAGVTIRGNKQGGLNFNGLNVYKGNKGHVHDVATELIAGSGSAPPDETFHINDQRCIDELYERIYLRIAGGGSGFGSNMSTRSKVKDFEFTDSSAAAGGAIYKGTDIEFHDGKALRNKVVGLNWEQMAGTNVVDHVEFAGNGVDMAFNANQDYKAGALWEIVEPIKPLGQPLTLRIGKGGYVDYQNTAADKTQSVTWDMIWLTVAGTRKKVADWPAEVVKLTVA